LCTRVIREIVPRGSVFRIVAALPSGASQRADHGRGAGAFRGGRHQGRDTATARYRGSYREASEPPTPSLIARPAVYLVNARHRLIHNRSASRIWPLRGRIDAKPSAAHWHQRTCRRNGHRHCHWQRLLPIISRQRVRSQGWKRETAARMGLSRRRRQMPSQGFPREGFGCRAGWQKIRLR
jgi:hypothetical protein